MTRTSMGVGRYVASEQDVTAGPFKAWGNPQAYRGVIYCPGHGQTATTVWKYAAPALDVLNAVASRFPTVTADLGGSATFGNNTVITRVGQAKTWLQGASSECRAKSGKIMLVFGSMGTLSALNWARTNAASVAAVVGLLPVVNLNGFYTENRGGYAAEVNTAYGGTYSVSTDGPTHSPSLFPASLDFPMKLWYVTGDTLGLPAETLAFAASAPQCQTVAASGTHGAPVWPVTLVDDILDFLALHA